MHITLHDCIHHSGTYTLHDRIHHSGTYTLHDRTQLITFNLVYPHEMNDKLTLGMFNVPPPDVPLVVYSDVWCNVLALLMYI